MKRVFKIVLVLFFLSIPIAIYLLNQTLFFCLTGFIMWLFALFVLFQKSTSFDGKMKHIRGTLLTWKSGNNKAKNITIGSDASIHNPETIYLGNNVSMGRNVEFFPLIEYQGNHYYPKIEIGNNVSIGDYNRFAYQDKIIIEDDVLLAAYVHITDHSHSYEDPFVSIMHQGTVYKGAVKIGKGSWIGIRCSILSGVTIGEHCVVAAGSIVTHNVPPYSVVAGAPAKIIKRYDFENKSWIKV